MKAKFKFSPGQTVEASNGLIGKVAIAGVTANGNQYLVRNDYNEQWTYESQLKGVGPAEPEISE